MPIYYNTEPLPASEALREQIYNAKDSMITLEVFEVLEKKLDEVTSKTYALEKALQGPVLEMDLRGVLVDITTRDDLIRDLSQKISLLESNLREIISEGIGVEIENPGSPKQLGYLLYDVLGLPVQRSFKTKGPSVDRKALEKLRNYFHAAPIINHVLAIRDLAKQCSTLRTSIDSDSRIRTSFNIAGTDTGRFSSYASALGTGTNTQNIAPELRRVFIADPGMKLAYIDLEQAESWAVAAIHWNLFQDATYLDLIATGDLHTGVCRMCWEELPWTGNMKLDKEIAKRPFYRNFSYRDASKRLGHACLTDDHEVLTLRGWVSIKEKPAVIMCWDPDNGSFFDEPSGWTESFYEGDMISFEGNSVSALMTPNHRVPYTPDVKDCPVRTKPASEGPGHAMPLGYGWVGGNEVVQARLLAAIMSDGNLNGKNTIFHLKKERKIERLKELADSYGIEWVVFNTQGPSTKISLRMQGPKHPGAFMLRWTKECLSAFLDEYKYWDGHTNGVHVTLSSKHKEDLEWLQTFGRISGIGGSVKGPTISGFGTPCYRLQQNNRRWASGGSIKTDRTPFSGTVYCPTVSSSYFYARRNGKIFVTGNSSYVGKPPQISREVHIELPLVQNFQVKFFKAIPSMQPWHDWVRQKLLKDGFITTFMGRRRHFFGRRWDEDTHRAAVAYEPQSAVADYLSKGILRVWNANICQILLQIHDAILIQYPEELENEIVPRVQQLLQVEVPLMHGKTLTIPTEAMVGYNWGYAYNDKKELVSPNGLVAYTGTDQRTRIKQESILDRKFSQA